MTHLRRHFQFFLAAIGFMLVAVGLAAGYWWHYKLAPMRHLADPEWLATHSEAARWEEEQKDYRRLGSSPDLCFRGDRIGFYGDKQWFLWLDERIRNPESFRHCGCTEYALSLMANRHVDSWAQWTDANRDRSQEEWIREGFLDYGVAAHLPPASDDTLPLLRLLGRKSWNVLWGGPQGTNAPEAIPSYIHYNAYRWLRDSGFEPGEFVSSNATVAAQPDITAGLLRYSQSRSVYPGNDGLGVLAFGTASSTGSDFDMRPVISKPWVVVGVDCFIAACMIGGAVLVWRFTKRTPDANRIEPDGAPNRSQPKRNCYCGIWTKSPETLRQQGVPEGFCGICERCGKPGHTSHHPGPVPYTGSWCDRCYRLLAWTWPFRVPLFWPVLGLLGWIGYNALSADTPNVPPLTLASLQNGLTQQQVEEQLKARGHHQFTAALSNGLARCVSYYRNDVYGHYYLVFTNDHLARICQPPPFEMRREPYQGTWANYRVLGDPETRLAAVLRAEDLTGPQLTAALKPQTSPKQSVDPGLTAAFLLAQKSVSAALKSERERKFLTLVKQYDPYQIAPGSTLASVEDQLGSPHITESLDGGREIRYYGDIEFGLSSSRELMWLSVVYEDGKVVRVYSRDFVDHDKVRPLEKNASRKINR